MKLIITLIACSLFLAAAQGHAVPIATTGYLECDPAVAYASTAYQGTPGVYLVVVFEQSGDIWGREVSCYGMTSMFNVSKDSRPERRPAVASLATVSAYFIAWELDYSSSDQDIYGTTAKP